MTISVPPLLVSFENPDWTLLRNLAIGLVVVLWLATAYWTFKDARRRIEDPWLVGMALVLGLVPPMAIFGWWNESKPLLAKRSCDPRSS